MATATIYIASSAGVAVLELEVLLAGANLSYEIAGAADGQAADWTEAQSVGAEDIADFGSKPFEDFESGFSSNENSQSLFALTDLQFALFEAMTQPYESFEHSWSNNEDSQSSFDIGDLQIALFDGATVGYEDFENGWSNNENFQVAFGGGDLDFCLFDTGTELYEDFENAWYGNNNSAPFPTATYVNYDVGAPEGVEDFEEEWVSTLGV